MFGRKHRRMRHELAEIRRHHAEMINTCMREEQEPVPQPRPVEAVTPVVDDFPPTNLRAPTRDEVEGMMMRRRMPLVLNGEVHACPQCGTYRDWIVFTLGDEVWLRCQDGHQALEPRLDTAWFDRNSGPNETRRATFEEGLRHLGHPKT
ncbi:hypothetical protein [Streptomyces sp. IB2014 016-6]|uniref:hypothetical protein n=1 Tax=Streptomyces sp. IB2014 016-6 TaxID=2517818 RepID=UPI0011C9AEA9|nr:hypothetical protein [Streptomyces sp. IB2014 016-6]TXL83938.1 hypothetical protein EW053_35830 [Streptomyces sp. IB2014 016-6]